MLKKSLLILGLLYSSDTFANWSARVQHFSMRDNLILALDNSHSAITLGLAYEHEFAEPFYVAANVFQGFNFDSDRGLFSGSDNAELDDLQGMELRLGYHLHTKFSLFSGIQYVSHEYRLPTESSDEDVLSRSDTDILLGLDYQFTQKMSLDAVYAQKGSGQSLTLGLSYHF